MTTSQFQGVLLHKLQARFGVGCAKEWRAFETSEGHYAPRLDLAVGPFAYGERQCGPEYDEASVVHARYLNELWAAFAANVREYTGHAPEYDFKAALASNWNARCFLAIEIENRVSRKHLMGGAINAAALGRIGVVVGWSDDKVRALMNLRLYLTALGKFNKPTFKTANLLVLSREQALALL